MSSFSKGRRYTEYDLLEPDTVTNTYRTPKGYHLSSLFPLWEIINNNDIARKTEQQEIFK